MMRFVSVLLFAIAATLLNGCGKNDDAGLTPPPAPTKPAQVNLAQPATSPGAPDAPQSSAGTPDTAITAPVPPPTTDEGLAAITKGMTPDQIKEFKETATIETFDTNIQLIQEAANSFYNEFHKRAPSVDALVAAGYLSHKPAAPKGKQYVIDPANGAIGSQDLTPSTTQ